MEAVESPNAGGHLPGTNELLRPFKCSQEGCKKSYTKVSHLYRHRLNHNPQYISKCDFPDCSKTFFRRDLLRTHREQHNNRTRPRKKQYSSQPSVSTPLSLPPEVSIAATTASPEAPPTTVTPASWESKPTYPTLIDTDPSALFSDWLFEEFMGAKQTWDLATANQSTIPPMVRNSLLGASVENPGPYVQNVSREYDLSEGKSAQIVRLMKGLNLKEDCTDDSYLLSREMMRACIESYWLNFNEQLPILHKSTFLPEDTPNPLLVTIMAIGASYLDTDQAGAELWEALAWDLRRQILTCSDSRPPAQLWVFQALLLLETYEKMYSTTALHENAHIHHGSTIVLMRRGNFLYEKRWPGAENTFQEWLIHETSRRVVFAAFIIDSIHSAMFGHSAAMVVKEMQLFLPCDEAQWSCEEPRWPSIKITKASSPNLKPIRFLEGLRRIINGQEAKTSLFGRTALIAGLLSLFWQMNQRDLQMNALSTSGEFFTRDSWRGFITRGFELWKKESDDGILGLHTMLYHLGHMATHADIMHCQTLAGNEEVLGRHITSQDSNTSQRYFRNWAPTANARHATWHALQFLCSVLLPENPDSPIKCSVHRPWVLYYAALVIWSYGYAREGPTSARIPQADNFEEQVRDMRAYLLKFGAVKSPDKFQSMTGFSSCIGMLMVICKEFENMRWELIRKAALTLRNCIQLLKGKS